MEKKLKLEEIKQIELNILKKFNTFCKEENLTYYLFEGTLLGAVKYKGFIPWDDDIDVCMPRKDYMILIDRLSKKPIEGLELFSVYNNKKYYYPYAKLVDINTAIKEENKKQIPNYGLFIDIFPIDGINGDEKSVKKYLSKMSNILNFVSIIQDTKICSNSKIKKIIKKINKPIMSLFGNTPIRLVDKLFEKKNDETSIYVAKSTNKGEYYKRSDFEGHMELEFEDEKFPVPNQYEEILKTKFGEYKKDPPKEKQITHHKFTAYRK